MYIPVFLQTLLSKLNFLLVSRCSLLFAQYTLLFARGSLLFAPCSLLFARCSLLFAHCSLLFVPCSLILLAACYFSFLVLLKEMRTWDEFKTSSCCFCVWCKLRELGGRGSKIPLRNPSGGKPLLRTSSRYNKLLGSVEFRILSNIHDGALLSK